MPRALAFTQSLDYLRPESGGLACKMMRDYVDRKHVLEAMRHVTVLAFGAQAGLP